MSMTNSRWAPGKACVVPSLAGFGSRADEVDLQSFVLFIPVSEADEGVLWSTTSTWNGGVVLTKYEGQGGRQEAERASTDVLFGTEKFFLVKLYAAR